MSRKLNHINLSYLESIADGDNRVIKEFIKIFLDQLPEFTNGFNSALSNKDWKAIAGIAHKAKSSMISMGMEELGNLDLKNLELIAKYFRIDVLSKKDDLSAVEKQEFINLQQSFTSYPDEKKAWIEKNASEELIESIINKFNEACSDAKHELNIILEKHNQ